MREHTIKCVYSIRRMLENIIECVYSIRRMRENIIERVYPIRRMRGRRAGRRGEPERPKEPYIESRAKVAPFIIN